MDEVCRVRRGGSGVRGVRRRDLGGHRASGGAHGGSAGTGGDHCGAGPRTGGCAPGDADRDNDRRPDAGGRASRGSDARTRGDADARTRDDGDRDARDDADPARDDADPARDDADPDRDDGDPDARADPDPDGDSDPDGDPGARADPDARADSDPDGDPDGDPGALGDAGRDNPWRYSRRYFEGDATGYIAFWNAGPRTVCSFVTEGFGALGDEHHAAARAAAEAWNEAVGGEPALFAYQPNCPEGFATAFADVRDCDPTYDVAREVIEYVPIIWVAAEAATGPYGGANACASINGTHNGVGPPGLQGWRAAAIIGPGADADAAGGYAATIAHELGHVLYLDHTCDAHSIMHAQRRCSTRYVPSGIIPADYLQIRDTLGRD